MEDHSMYGVFPYWHRPEFQMEWTSTLGQAIKLIEQSVQGERNDELFYDELIRMAPSVEEANIITSIRNDERSHHRMFRQIYKALTSYDIPASNKEPYVKTDSYVNGLQRAL